MQREEMMVEAAPAAQPQRRATRLRGRAHRDTCSTLAAVGLFAGSVAWLLATLNPMR